MTHQRSKHVEFYSKNKFEKSVHLVGFIIRIYHDRLKVKDHISQTQPSLLVFVQNYNIRATCSEL